MNKEISKADLEKLGIVADNRDPEAWHDGKPPHKGWWNASRSKNHGTWRWWNGKQWSQAILNSPEGDASELKELVKTKAYRDEDRPVQWSWYYPPNAVVARINPKTGEVTGAIRKAA